MSQAPTSDRPRSRATRPEPAADVVTPQTRLADWVLIASFLALTFMLGIFPLKDTDFWWHLKAGDLIRQAGEIPRVDTFTYGAEGSPWVDLHWGFQVALSWGYAHGGVVMLNLAKCAITTLAVFLLVHARRRDWPVWAMLLAWLPALLVLGGRMYIRPETISLLYLATVLAILFRWDRRPWLALGLPIVQVCWVNTQGLFLLEPVLIAFALAGALFRPGAFDRERRGWWRTVTLATALTGLACLFNPYGIAGAIYPIELAGTMSNPIFRDTIGELKPLLKFIEEVGFDSLPLQLHIATFVLGVLSFVVPALWSGWARIADRRATTASPADLPKGRQGREPARPRKKAEPKRSDAPGSWGPYVFRGLMFSSFSALSLAATRNSHQFAAVVGTVTAWNFGEWAAAVRARRLRFDPAAPRSQAWPRAVAFSAIALAFGSVASGRFYAWAGEGRTVGLGEQPLWFPHEAVRFAGSPGMPDRMVGFHNGHPSLFEYYFAPGKKVYTDARLEVMGPVLYRKYNELSRHIGEDDGKWAEELDAMGRPSVLVDNLDVGNAKLSANLLLSAHWKLVWFDPIACVFVHDSLAKVVSSHEVKFADLHFRRQADSSLADPASLAATSRALRSIGQFEYGHGGGGKARPTLLLGLDYARKQREVDPGGLDGWKQAGLVEYIRDIIPGDEVIPRFRMPFDPVFDLSTARATYDLKKALEIAPDDGYVLYSLANSFQMRGMGEEALPLLERFAGQPNKNLSQRRQKALSENQVQVLRARLGPSPATGWKNLSEMERVVAGLLASGRASTAAEVMGLAYPAEARPWEWADRLAVLQLHLGHPDVARVAWLAATEDAPAATRGSRIAATYVVEGHFELARRFYREAIAADPRSFEAHYGLAYLEQDAGNADRAVEAARLAEKSTTNAQSLAAARQIIATASPFATPGPARP